MLLGRLCRRGLVADLCQARYLITQREVIYPSLSDGNVDEHKAVCAVLISVESLESPPRFFWFFAFLSPCISFVIFPAVQLVSSPILRREARKWCGQHSANHRHNVTLTKDNQTKSTKTSSPKASSPNIIVKKDSKISML